VKSQEPARKVSHSASTICRPFASATSPPAPRLPQKPPSVVESWRQQEDAAGRRQRPPLAALAPSSSTAATVATPKMRMGTRTSISALHRERIRTNHVLPPSSLRPPPRLPPPPPPPPPPTAAANSVERPSLDLDFQAMEEKSVWAVAAAAAAGVKSGGGERLDHGGADESLSDSLVERFDAMESAAGPSAAAAAEEEGDGEYALVACERRIVSVSVAKEASSGLLGLRLTGTAGGVYVEGGVDAAQQGGRVLSGRLQVGDRLVAVDGRSLEDVGYDGTIQLIRMAGSVVQLLLSQIVHQ
jgi:hypothetical protein